MISELIEEKCILCDDQDLSVMIPRENLPDHVSVLTCNRCRLVFLGSRNGNAKEDPEEHVYWDDQKQTKIYSEEKIADGFTDEFKRRLSTLRRLVPTSGRLLDVGCGIGHFLSVARKDGWNVTGLDISPVAAEAAQGRYELKVAVGTLEDALFKEHQFDVITLWDVIEHIRKPIENLKAANQFLAPGGILILKTPNEHGLFKQLALFCYRIFGSRAAFLLKYVYYVPHYFSYSIQTLNLLLNKCGFETVHVEMDTTPSDFATEKIHAHYHKDKKRFMVLFFLPIAQLIARLFHSENKMTIYAKKVIPHHFINNNHNSRAGLNLPYLSVLKPSAFSNNSRSRLNVTYFSVLGGRFKQVVG